MVLTASIFVTRKTDFIVFARDAWSSIVAGTSRKSRAAVAAKYCRRETSRDIASLSSTYPCPDPLTERFYPCASYSLWIWELFTRSICTLGVAGQDSGCEYFTSWTLKRCLRDHHAKLQTCSNMAKPMHRDMESEKVANSQHASWCFLQEIESDLLPRKVRFDIPDGNSNVR